MISQLCHRLAGHHNYQLMLTSDPGSYPVSPGLTSLPTPPDRPCTPPCSGATSCPLLPLSLYLLTGILQSPAPPVTTVTHLRSSALYFPEGLIKRCPQAFVVRPPNYPVVPVPLPWPSAESHFAWQRWHSPDLSLGHSRRQREAEALP